MTLNENVSITLTGNSTTGLAVSLSPSYTLKNATVGDYLHDTYSIDANTSNKEIDLGEIETGKHLLVITDGLLTITITQDSTDRNIDVNGAFLLDGDFTALKVSNADTRNAAQLTILVAGERPLT